MGGCLAVSLVSIRLDAERTLGPRHLPNVSWGSKLLTVETSVLMNTGTLENGRFHKESNEYVLHSDTNNYLLSLEIGNFL